MGDFSLTSTPSTRHTYHRFLPLPSPQLLWISIPFLLHLTVGMGIHSLSTYHGFLPPLHSLFTMDFWPSPHSLFTIDFYPLLTPHSPSVSAPSSLPIHHRFLPPSHSYLQRVSAPPPTQYFSCISSPPHFLWMSALSPLHTYCRFFFFHFSLLILLLLFLLFFLLLRFWLLNRNLNLSQTNI